MSKVEYVAVELEKKIETGHASKGEPFPSAREIAKDFNVSYVTAYKAVSKLVDKNMLFRMDGKGTFVAGNALASETKTLGVLWGAANEMDIGRKSLIFSPVLMGISKKAGEKRFNIRNIFMNEYIDREIWDVDYVISVQGMWTNKEYIEKSKKIRCPHLYLSLKSQPFCFCNNFCIDLHGMFRQAFEYLRSLGYSRIGLVDFEKNAVPDRERAFTKVKELLNMPHSEKWIMKSGPYTGYKEAVEHGKFLADEIFKKHSDMDAVISISDHVAFGIYQKVLECNKKLAVIGTDNAEGAGYMESPFNQPVLTCVAPSSYWDIGERAVDAVEKLKNLPGGEYSNFYIQPELIKRKSCGEKEGNKL